MEKGMKGNNYRDKVKLFSLIILKEFNVTFLCLKGGAIYIGFEHETKTEVSTSIVCIVYINECFCQGLMFMKAYKSVQQLLMEKSKRHEGFIC